MFKGDRLVDVAARNSSPLTVRGLSRLKLLHLLCFYDFRLDTNYILLTENIRQFVAFQVNLNRYTTFNTLHFNIFFHADTKKWLQVNIFLKCIQENILNLSFYLVAYIYPNVLFPSPSSDLS